MQFVKLLLILVTPMFFVVHGSIRNITLNLFSLVTHMLRFKKKLISFGNLNAIIWSRTIKIDHFYLHHLQYYYFLIFTTAGNAYLELELIQLMVSYEHSQAAIQKCSWQKVLRKYAANIQENTHAKLRVQ